MKDKYREVVELLRDTQEELKKSKKKSYPGMGKHSVTGMFPSSSAKQGECILSTLLHVHTFSGFLLTWPYFWQYRAAVP